MNKNICVYCNEHEGKEWDKTGEIVCLPCRFDFLVQEFQDAGLLQTKDDKMIIEITKDMLN